MSPSNNKWFFPVADYGTKQGLNDSGLETFLNSPLESLVRETIQNSLDAKKRGSEGPVKVSFNFITRKIKDIPGVENLEGEYLKAGLNSWINDTAEHKFLKSFTESIEDKDDNLNILKVSDYNTTGLDEESWNALVTETGVSSKADSQAAGSKGIGKNAPFAASMYRIVMYNTKTDNYERSIGVINCVSYVEENGVGVSQSRGFLGSSYNEPFDKQYALDNERNEVGTDVFVIGVKHEYADSQNLIILNVLEHFLLSIFNENLIVAVDGLTINKDSIDQHIVNLLQASEEIEESRALDVMRDYNVLTNENTKTIYLDKDLVEKYPFISNVNLPFSATPCLV